MTREKPWACKEDLLDTWFDLPGIAHVAGWEPYGLYDVALTVFLPGLDPYSRI